jgi:hypothetical protein
MARSFTGRFLILCQGRTGSNHLVSLLDSHPEIRCYFELFALVRGFDEHFSRSGHTEPGSYLDELLGRAGIPCAGFKLTWNSMLAYPNTVDLLESGNFAVVRLYRQNRLAQLVSGRLVERSGVSQSTEGSYGTTRVRVDAARCLDRLRMLELIDRVLDSLASSSLALSISLEDLGSQERLVGLQEALGVTPHALTSEYERLRTRPLPEVVINWDEVAEALQGTRFERYLEES